MNFLKLFKEKILVKKLSKESRQAITDKLTQLQKSYDVAKTDERREQVKAVYNALLAKAVIEVPEFVTKSRVNSQIVASPETYLDNLKVIKHQAISKTKEDKMVKQFKKQNPSVSDDEAIQIVKTRIMADEKSKEGLDALIDFLSTQKMFEGTISNDSIDYVAPKEPKRVPRKRELKKDIQREAITTADELRMTGKKFKRISEAGNVYYEYRMNRRDVDKKIKLKRGGQIAFESEKQVMSTKIKFQGQIRYDENGLIKSIKIGKTVLSLAEKVTVSGTEYFFKPVDNLYLSEEGVPLTLKTLQADPLFSVKPKFEAGGHIQDRLDYISQQIHNLKEVRSHANEEDYDYYDSTIAKLEREKSELASGKKKRLFGFFKEGGAIGLEDTEYIPNRNIKRITILRDGKEKTYAGDSLLDGVYLKNGSKEIDFETPVSKPAKTIKKAIESSNGIKLFDISEAQKEAYIKNFESDYNIDFKEFLNAVNNLDKNSKYLDVCELYSEKFNGKIDLSEKDSQIKFNRDFLNAVACSGTQLKNKIYTPHSRLIEGVKVIPVSQSAYNKSGFESLDIIKGNDKLRPMLTTVFFEDNNLVATDAQKLVVIPRIKSDEETYDFIEKVLHKTLSKTLVGEELKTELDKELSKIKQTNLQSVAINPEGKIENGKYPNYKAVIHEPTAYSGIIDINNFVNALNGYILLGKKTHTSIYQLKVTFGEIEMFLNAELVYDLLRCFQGNNAKTIVIGTSENPSKAVNFYSDNGCFGIVMPMFIAKETDPNILSSNIQIPLNGERPTNAKFEKGGAVGYPAINYLGELWFAVHQRETDKYSNLAEKLDDEGVSFSIQNKVAEDAINCHKKAIDTAEVADRIKKIIHQN